MWPILLDYVAAQAFRTFHFSFPLLRHGPPSYSFNFTSIYFLYFIWKRVARAMLIKSLCKKLSCFYKYVTPRVSLWIYLSSPYHYRWCWWVLLLFESVSWSCVFGAIAVVPVPSVVWLCELWIALIRSSVALFNVITGTYLFRHTRFGGNLKRKRVNKDSHKG